MKHKLLSTFVFLFAATMCSYAQRTITGVITSSRDREPLIGATILVQNTGIGTTTDVDGKYSLSVPDSAKNLVVSYTGMKTKIVLITGTTLNIAIDENQKMLDDVVVTAQAVKREKRSLGYSTTTVTSEDLNQASPTSALDALQGKVAGAQITNTSGAPGGSTRVVLRGGSSLTGDNNALIVVDGVPIDNSNFGFADVLNNGYDAGNRANDINPEDIETVTVLKGASAVALYGQRGANGAILYTTKSGKSTVKSGKKFKVTLSENIQAETPLKLPTMQNQFGQGSEDNYGNAYFDTRQNWSWGPAFNGQNMFWGTPVIQPNGTSQLRVKPYSAVPDNFSSFFNVGATYNSNVAISGGDPSSSYYASFNNVKYDGIVPTTGYQRNSLRLNASHDFGEHITLTGSFNYTNTSSVLPVSGQGTQGIYQLLLNTPRDIPVQELRDLSNPFNAPSQYYDPFVPNPYWALQQFRTTDNVDRFLTNMNLEYKPTKWLNIVERFGADIYTDTREQDWNSFSFYPIYYYQGVTSPSPTPSSYIGKYDQDRYTVDNISSDLMATFTQSFKHDVTFSALIGNNIYSNTLKNTYGETNGLIIPGYYNFNNSAARPTLVDQTFVNRLIGVYADINVGYKNFLFFELTGRNDWSSTLPLDNRSYFYPGVGGSLVFTELGKKKINPMILSFGKIRANFAQIGKDAPPYSLKNYFVPGGLNDGYLNTDIKTPYYSPANSNIPGYSLSGTLSNPTLKPEISTTWEVGTELGWLKDRITIDATYYYKETKNEILTIPVAASTGYSSQIVNAGILRNQGVELAVRITPVITPSGFKWDIYGTFTKNISKVIEVSNNSEQIILGGTSAVTVVAQKGQPFGSFYGAGLLTNAAGQVVVDSGVGVPKQSTKPQVLGNYQPTWLGSIGTSFSYKGFKLAILFDGRDGGQFYSATAGIQQFLGNDIATTYNNRQPFVVPNSVYLGSDDKYHANMTKTGAYNYWYAVSTIPSYQIISSSFLKLREISLTYSFPAKLLAKSKAIKGLSVKAYASNVWIWTPKSNTFGDPEVSSSGIGAVQGYEYYNIPSLRNFGGGFTIDF